MPTKILLMTGAGASKPLGLPTTTEFTNALSGTGAKVLGFIQEYLGPTRKNDIEAVLSTLENFNGGSEFTHFLFERLTSTPNHNSELTRFRRLHSEAATELLRIKKAIHSQLAKFDIARSLQLYQNLLKEIEAAYADWSLSFVTTNYDLTFDEAISSGLKKSDGSEVSVNTLFEMDRGRLIYSSRADFQWADQSIEFFKIHGSLDWHFDNQQRCTRSGAATTPDNPEIVPIIYPGNKLVPESEPFASLHQRFYRRLAEADVAFVVGFAFRDGYINTAFENVLAVRPKLPIYVINPLDISQFPSDSKLPSIVQRFLGVRHIKSGLLATESPLGLADILKNNP